MKKVKFVALIILGILIVPELYLRIFHYETLKTRTRDLAYIPDSLYGYLYKPNSEQAFIWPGISKKFRFNNHGFYGPDFSETKDKDTYRIIFVGNSVTLGIRTNGDKNFVIKLQDLFKQAKYNVEIINCSVDGRSRDVGNMNIVKYITPKYHPDLVMFEYHFPLTERYLYRDQYRDYMIRYDDSTKILIPEFKSKIDKIYAAKFLRKVYDLSFSVRAFCRWIDNNKDTRLAKFINSKILRTEYITAYIRKEKGKEKKIKNISFSREESIKMYNDLYNYLDSLNIKFATYNLRNQSNAKSKLPNILNFAVHLEQDEEIIIRDEGHLNNKGHEQIANDLFYQLKHSSALPLNNYKDIK
jgi:hypothetical protein